MLRIDFKTENKNPLYFIRLPKTGLHFVIEKKGAGRYSS